MCFLVVESMPVIRIPLQKEKSFCREFSWIMTSLYMIGANLV
jgi:hypothetical protein